tara:strand:+ start:146 stop:1216 length:1071 start_codon:yes stop_codon:yes gene_type:complete
MTFFLEYFLINNFIYSLLILTCIISFFVFGSFKNKYFFKERRQVQNIHGKKVVPRVGGIVVIFSTVIHYIFFMDHSDIYDLIFLTSIPIIIFGFIEDAIGSTRPIHRLLAIIISSFFFFYLTNQKLPYVDIPFLGNIIHFNSFTAILFFVLALSAYTNGVNMIDGTNGLAVASIISSLASVAFISYMVNDYEIMYLTMFFSTFLIPFLLFNYPWGKIFLGDTGAYFYGWITGLTVIIFFGRHSDIPTWGAALILFYPSFEIIFSFIRKKLASKSPFEPDANHLHMKVYYVFKTATNRQLRSNGLVTPFLSALWLIPPMIIPWVFTDPILIIICIIFLVIIYLSFYFALPNHSNVKG